jgi:uncharacterized protein (TIGR04255 family)
MASNLEMTSVGELPRFEAPPVIETVLGVFFRPLRRLNTVEQGVFWNEVLRGDFPKYELRPPIEEVSERFEGKSAIIQGVHWQVSSEPETPRLWAISPSGEHILQVQRNAILANWLRRGANYLPFQERITSFGSRLNQLGEYARLKDFQQQFSPTSCTATYINQIPIEENEPWAKAAERVLTCFSNPAIDWLPPIDRGRLQFSFPFASERGRLHVVAIPALQEEGQTLVMQLELTARLGLAKEAQTADAALAAVRTAHDWIVRGFATLTRPEMHEIWRRIR